MYRIICLIKFVMHIQPSCQNVSSVVVGQVMEDIKKQFASLQTTMQSLQITVKEQQEKIENQEAKLEDQQAKIENQEAKIKEQQAKTEFLERRVKNYGKNKNIAVK